MCDHNEDLEELNISARKTLKHLKVKIEVRGDSDCLLFSIACT